MRKRKTRPNLLLDEVIGIVLIGLALLLVVSLLSYNSYDTSYHASPPNEPPHNIAGETGAYLSEVLFFYLGWGALLLPVLMLFWGFGRIRRGEDRGVLSRGLGGLLFILSLSSLFSLSGIGEHLRIAEASLPAGGFVGSWTGRHLTTLFGPLAYLVTILGTLLGYILSLNLSIIASLKMVKEATAFPIKGLVRRFEGRVPRRPPRQATREIPPRIVMPKGEKEETIQVETRGEEKREELQPQPYQLPDISLLDKAPAQREKETREELLSISRLLENSLAEFGVEAKVIQVNQGPTVTRFELQPAPGVKVARIVSLSDDIALTLATPNVRIETPIPGKQAIGIEIPNRKPATVHLREILQAPEFVNSPSRLAIALGKDLAGHAVVIDLARMPHLLIAGTTGSGKSICINAIITSILYQATPKEVKLMLIDPKRVEFIVFKDIPHLITPIITDAKKSAVALKWLVNEMEERYKALAEIGVRDIEGYNQYALKDSATTEELPYIIMIIDELADLMMVALNDCEEAITRLAQMARAVGIHIVLATQRPSVDVITGIIKANLPSRIAFQVSSKVDSRTILDMNGAEKLLGAGDMLFAPAGAGRPVRLQGSYISLSEIERVVGFIKAQADMVEIEKTGDAFLEPVDEKREHSDELYEEALRVAARREVISASMLQRQLRIGYNRAARFIETMQEEGIVGPPDGAKPRRVYHDKLIDYQ